jgi:hypothetical protein
VGTCCLFLLGYTRVIEFLLFLTTELLAYILLFSKILFYGSTCRYFSYFLTCFAVDYRKLEVPLIWDVEHDLVRYKKDCTVDAKKGHDLME